MKITWANSNQHYPPTMSLFRVGQVIDTTELGISDATARAWVADGYATRVLEPGDPEQIEEAEPVAKKPVRARKTKAAI